MWQDIGAHQIDAGYRPREPREDDWVVVSHRDGFWLRDGVGGSSGPGVNAMPGLPFPTLAQLAAVQPPSAGALIASSLDAGNYLMSFDGHAVYRMHPSVSSMLANLPHAVGGFAPKRLPSLRGYLDMPGSFACATALHLARFYDDHVFCSHCGGPLEHAEHEHALGCPRCGINVHPTISPAVIVAIRSGERLLLTRYSGGYPRHALVAGFCEVGETLEDTVRREVMEEVGLRVRDIRYWASQPWALSHALLMGFTAEVDGSDEVHLNTDGLDELAEAEWFARDEIMLEDSELSLTWSMIAAFKRGEL